MYGQGQRFPLKVELMKSGKILVKRHPSTHGVTGVYFDTFEKLLGILSRGFTGNRPPNIAIEEQRGEGYIYADKSQKKDTWGDEYTIELMAPVTDAPYGQGFVKEAGINDITRIIIELNPQLTQQVISQRKALYKQQLGKSGIPIKFIEAQRKK